MRYTDYQFTVPDEKQVRVITNTDAKNEADDPFAIVQALLSPKLDNVGMIAAHFGAERAPDGMERSYAELETIFDTMGMDKRGMLYRGAPRAMRSPSEPVDSEGARLIIREALKDDPRPLFVTFLGPLTDMASALLLEPRIASRLTVIWIGGGSYPMGGREFNLSNDIHAANVVFSSQVALWQVPRDVYCMMTVSLAELEYKVRPCGAIGAHLCDQLERHSHEPAPRQSAFRKGESWVLGDNPTVGLLLYENANDYQWRPAPAITGDMAYLPNDANRPIRVYRSIDSRLVLEDLFAKLALFARRHG